jgi:hypothetical protein
MPQGELLAREMLSYAWRAGPYNSGTPREEEVAMLEPYQIVLLTLAAVIVVKLLVLLILGKGSLSRLGLATAAFTRALGDAGTAERLRPVLYPPPPEPPKPVKLSPEPVRLLALLQREGRLVDFLLEDLSGATDVQIVASVQQLHPKAQAVLKEHLILEPVMPQQEMTTVEVPAGFDPSAIRVTGNVTGQPPFRGTLMHHGWRVKSYTLPPLLEGQDALVLHPAEVEVQ